MPESGSVSEGMPILKTKQTWKRAPDPNSLREKNRLLPINGVLGC